MYNYKTFLSSENLKDRLIGLMESLDKVNTSKMIIERSYAKICAIEIKEGKNAQEVFKHLKENKMDAGLAVNAMNKHSTVTAYSDSNRLEKIAILEALNAELEAYAWMPQISNYLADTKEFLAENQLQILAESVINDLSVNKDSKFYKNSIEKIGSVLESENLAYALVKACENHKWIPLVKQLSEHCETLIGNAHNMNPNFVVSKIYSPIAVLSENTFVFYSNGKLLETDGTELKESQFKPNVSFIGLVNISESAKFSENSMRIYPNSNTTVDFEYTNEGKKSFVNGVLVESNLESYLYSSGILKYTNSNTPLIVQAIQEGDRIKEIDLGYRITSKQFDGVSASVYTVNETLYVQKTNHKMKTNEFIKCDSVTEAIDLVKNFINYDITNTVSNMLNAEMADKEYNKTQINKINENIQYLFEKLAEVERSAKVSKIENTEAIQNAKSFILKQIQEQKDNLADYGVFESSVCNSVTDLVPGKEYSIDGVDDYIYQGKTGDAYIFNTSDKENPTPVEMNLKQISEIISKGKIQCLK